MTFLEKPFSYILFIVLGYGLKRLGFFRQEDRAVLSKVMLNITLPCAVVQAFSGFERETRLYFIVLMGFVCTLLPLLIMYAAGKSCGPRLRVFRMLNAGGYNIGCFAMPLLTAFFGSQGVIVSCMFDIGNAVMMTGGAYALTSSLLHLNAKKESAWDIAKKFLTSVPFDTYMLMLLLSALNIRLPQIVYSLTQSAAQANAFVAMTVIGLMFEPVFEKSLLSETVKELLCRYALALLYAAAAWWVLPFDLLTRQVLVVLAFAPISSLAPIYTDRCGGDTALAGFANSVSIAIGLVVMLSLSILFTAA